jgi:hypothetical protein
VKPVKPNLLGNQVLCLEYTGVWLKQVKLTKISYIRTLIFKVGYYRIYLV